MSGLMDDIVVRVGLQTDDLCRWIKSGDQLMVWGLSLIIVILGLSLLVITGVESHLNALIRSYE